MFRISYQNKNVSEKIDAYREAFQEAQEIARPEERLTRLNEVVRSLEGAQEHFLEKGRHEFPSDLRLNTILYGSLAALGVVAGLALAPVMGAVGLVGAIETGVIAGLTWPALTAALDWASGDDFIRKEARGFLEKHEVKKFDQLKQLSREIKREHDTLSRQVAISAPSSAPEGSSTTSLPQNKHLSQSFSSVATPAAPREKPLFVLKPAADKPANYAFPGQKR